MSVLIWARLLGVVTFLGRLAGDGVQLSGSGEHNVASFERDARWPPLSKLRWCSAVVLPCERALFQAVVDAGVPSSICIKAWRGDCSCTGCRRFLGDGVPNALTSSIEESSLSAAMRRRRASRASVWACATALTGSIWSGVNESEMHTSCDAWSRQNSTDSVSSPASADAGERADGEGRLMDGDGGSSLRPLP